MNQLLFKNSRIEIEAAATSRTVNAALGRVEIIRLQEVYIAYLRCRKDAARVLEYFDVNCFHHCRSYTILPALLKMIQILQGRVMDQKEL